MKSFQIILILGAALSALTIQFAECLKCQASEPVECTASHCDDHNTKPCIWNPEQLQCHCPHDGDNDKCHVDSGNNCNTEFCINEDSIRVSCGEIEKIRNLPDFLNIKTQKDCSCPTASSCTGKQPDQCETGSCGILNNVCDKGFQNICSCRIPCGQPCDCGEQNCADPCVCTQNIDDEGHITSTCQPPVLNSPCNCAADKCGTTDFVCDHNPIPDTCACKVALGECCDETSDCAGNGVCNENGKCKIPLCNACEQDPDHCDNSVGGFCNQNDECKIGLNFPCDTKNDQCDHSDGKKCTYVSPDVYQCKAE